MPILADNKSCTGCSACGTICPKSAIKMEADGMGFKYPVVDYNVCVECKLCEKSCPIINISYDVGEQKIQNSFAAQLKDNQQLKKSQSGGAFYAIAVEALNKDSIVYGAGFDKDLSVRHMYVRDFNELEELRYSKYVQSDLGQSFSVIIKNLKDGNKVLFSGTPCQVAGLKNVIPKEYSDNLTTVDLVCHGVPGPYFYRQYINYLEKRYKKKIVKFIFRDKEKYGWHSNRESVVFEDGVKKTFYYYNFLFRERDLISRNACSQCRFCSLKRVSDITIADCWGWEKLQRHDFDSSKGISLVIANTEKGISIVKSISNEMNLIEVDLKYPLLQRNLREPSPRPELSDKISKDFAAHGFSYINSHYGYNSLMAIRYRIKRGLFRNIHKLKLGLKK